MNCKAKRVVVCWSRRPTKAKGFDFNSATNGFSLDKKLHGSHDAYNKYVIKQLDDWAATHKEYKPEDAREFIQNTLIPSLEKKVQSVQDAGTKTLNETFKTQ